VHGRRRGGQGAAPPGRAHDGGADHLGVDDAAVAGERVGVGELGHRPGGRRRRPPVVQPRQAHDAVPHEGSVAAGAPGGRVQIGRGGAHAGGDAGLVAAVHDGVEDPGAMSSLIMFRALCSYLRG